MTRPSHNTDQRLLQAAQELLLQQGLGGLKVREVARKAGVNLGMFHYNFKNKEKFTHRVLQETYEKFFKEFTLESGKEGKPIDRLRGAIITLARFIRDHRQMVLGIFQDVLRKDKSILDFVKANVPRHVLVIIGLVRECQREGSIRKGPLTLVMSHVMGANLGPILILAVLEHLSIKDIRFIPVKLLGKTLASDKAITQRVDFVLESLEPKAKR